MRKLSYCLLSALMLILTAAGCSKNSGDDAMSLLRTVPADASSVVVINLAHIVDKLGCSTDGTTVKLSKDLQKAIDESQALKDKDRKGLKDVCAGETGVSISSLVFFSGARMYITGLLNDPDKFVAYIQKANPGSALEEEDGVKMIANIAVIGNQFWSCETGRPDTDQLKYYSKLNEKQSYAASDAASLLLDADKSATYVADVNRMLSMVPDATYARLVLSLVFNDLTYVAGYVDLNKKTVTTSASPLDSEMKPAELLLPTDKIDTSVVKNLGGGGDIVVAMAVTPKLIKKITDIAGSAMGGGSMSMTAFLESIDGTVAMRMNTSSSDIEARIQTNGKDFADLSNALQNLGGLTVTRDGNTLTAIHGNRDFNGPISASIAADKLKGAWIGVVNNGIIARDVVSFTRLVPEKKSLRRDMEGEGGVDALMNAILK